MPRNSMSRYNHNDRMNSYSQYGFGGNDHRHRRHYNDRNEEPEWFSEGPTSQNDTIELRGFEEYSGRRDSPSSRNSNDADEDKASADYESDGEKANDENDKSNDSNNNDKNGSEEASQRDADTEKANDYEPEDIEVANAEPKPNKKDDNFNFEDFLKAENITDLLSVSSEFFNFEQSLFERMYNIQFYFVCREVMRAQPVNRDLADGSVRAQMLNRNQAKHYPKKLRKQITVKMMRIIYSLSSEMERTIQLKGWHNTHGIHSLSYCNADNFR